MQPTSNNSNKTLGIGIGLVIFAAVIIGSYIIEKNSQAQVSTDQTVSTQTTPAVETTPSSTGTPVATTPAVVPPTPSPVASPSTYKDGTYSATGAYMSPGGEDQLGVTVTLKNGLVTDVSLKLEAADNTSMRYQQRFASGYRASVVGKDISTLKVGRVSGSSLTPIGFNDAISQIKAQAKA